MLFTGLSGWLDGMHLMPGGFAPRYTIYPLQTVVCAGILLYYWRDYRLAPPRAAWLAVAIGAVVFALWVSPQVLFHQPPRVDGFNPDLFGAQPAIYSAVVIMRFLRLILVVPALEEIFWRGFLLRYLIKEDFDSIPFGAYAQLSNILVAVGFMFEHSAPDWPAALVTGILYNFVAYRTRSLSSCIVAHALTNALLGLYIMNTRQWGFW
jgi:CAAX prenyl protease-like protein